MARQSFFDDEADNLLSKNPLWMKVSSNGEDSVPISLVQMEGSLLRYDAKDDQLIERYIVLMRDRLYYKRDKQDDAFKGYLSLDFTRLEVQSQKEILEQADTNAELRLRFIHNQKYSDLFAPNQELMKEWI